MTHAQHWQRYEESIDEWLEELPLKLDHGPIGMWEILPAGRHGFGLQQDALVDFVRASVRRLLECGARPVRRRKDGPYSWVVQSQYGDTPDEILASLIEDWASWDGSDPDRGGLWFATPDMWSIPNQPIDEWIESLASGLDQGPVSLSEITLTARAEYDLTGADLLSVARDAMHRLLERGARPARISSKGTPGWLPVRQYGEAIDEMLDAVTAEWTRKGVDDLLSNGFAFALPRDIDS